MKRAAALLAGVALTVLGARAVTAGTMEDVKAYPSCDHCGMNRDSFSHSRMLLSYEDGKVVGTCSIRCVALDLSRNPARKVKSVQVADHDTRELLDPEKATWVMGGNQRGVMTRTPKWAFANREAADAFIAANGGEITTYAAALAAARKELDGGAKRGGQGGKTAGKESACCCGRGK